MISTVSSRIASDTHPVDVIRNSFPMGSMTGAPKIAAMNIIEELEESKRGLYWELLATLLQMVILTLT